MLSRVSHLHQVWSDGVLHKNSEGTGDSQVLRCDWVTSPSDKKVDIEWIDFKEESLQGRFFFETSYLLDATTILPKRSLMSARLVVNAKTAMISLGGWLCQ